MSTEGSLLDLVTIWSNQVKKWTLPLGLKLRHSDGIHCMTQKDLHLPGICEDTEVAPDEGTLRNMATPFKEIDR